MREILGALGAGLIVWAITRPGPQRWIATHLPTPLKALSARRPELYVGFRDEGPLTARYWVGDDWLWPVRVGVNNLGDYVAENVQVRLDDGRFYRTPDGPGQPFDAMGVAIEEGVTINVGQEVLVHVADAGFLPDGTWLVGAPGRTRYALHDGEMASFDCFFSAANADSIRRRVSIARDGRRVTIFTDSEPRDGFDPSISLTDATLRQ